MMSADVKTIRKQEVIAESYKCLCVPSKLEVQCKKGAYFPIQLVYVL